MWRPGHVFVVALAACALDDGSLKASDDTALIHSDGLYEGSIAKAHSIIFLF